MSHGVSDLTTSSQDEKNDYVHDDTLHHQIAGSAKDDVNLKLANPLAGISQDQLLRDGAAFAHRYNLGHLEKEFAKGAVIAQDPLRFELLTILDEADKEILRHEQNNKWSQPKDLYMLVVMCSVCAAVQGMDETVINGAQLFFAHQFGIDPVSIGSIQIYYYYST